MLLAVGATKGKLLFVGTRLTAKYFFDAVNVRYAAEILVRGADEKGAILEQPQTLEQAGIWPPPGSGGTVRPHQDGAVGSLEKVASCRFPVPRKTDY